MSGSMSRYEVASLPTDEGPHDRDHQTTGYVARQIASPSLWSNPQATCNRLALCKVTDTGWRLHNFTGVLWGCWFKL
jgi:hypothetical protein